MQVDPGGWPLSCGAGAQSGRNTMEDTLFFLTSAGQGEQGAQFRALCSCERYIPAKAILRHKSSLGSGRIHMWAGPVTPNTHILQSFPLVWEFLVINTILCQSLLLLDPHILILFWRCCMFMALAPIILNLFDHMLCAFPPN